MVAVTGPLQIWNGADGSSHFLRISNDLSDELRAHALVVRRGFGSVRVEAQLKDVVWRTSVFPSRDGGYFLPVKTDVLRRTGIVVGDPVTIELDLL
jgi:hypothetical protein